LTVWIEKRVEDFNPKNYAPMFDSELDSAYEFNITDNQGAEQVLDYDIKLPKISDDLNEFKKMTIGSKSLGKASYSNGGSPVSRADSIISYDKDTNAILFSFSDYASLIKANGTHTIVIKLYDEQGDE